MKEIWKDIKDFEGIYQVSNFGNVKSFNYMNNGTERTLTPKKNNKGYLWVELRKNGIRKCALIHRLVAEAFIENPNNFPVINHKDENPLNNHMDNLEWCTFIYNVRYSLNKHPERLSRKNAKESKNYRRHKKKLIMLDKNENILNVFDSVSSFCKSNNKNAWSIIQCCYGNRKTAYGYKWRFAE